MYYNPITAVNLIQKDESLLDIGSTYSITSIFSFQYVVFFFYGVFYCKWLDRLTQKLNHFYSIALS